MFFSSEWLASSCKTVGLRKVRQLHFANNLLHCYILIPVAVWRSLQDAGLRSVFSRLSTGYEVTEWIEAWWWSLLENQIILPRRGSWIPVVMMDRLPTQHNSEFRKKGQRNEETIDFVVDVMFGRVEREQHREPRNNLSHRQKTRLQSETEGGNVGMVQVSMFNITRVNK